MSEKFEVVTLVDEEGNEMNVEVPLAQEDKNNAGEDSSSVIYGSPNRIETRSMVVTGMVDEDMASAICSKLINFCLEDPDSPVVIYLNTYGGSAYDMMAIYDIMQYVKCPIYTVGFGKIMSAGVLLLAAGEKGHRYLLPHTSVMVHRVRGGALGTVDDIASSSAHIIELQKDMQRLLMKHSSIKVREMKDFMTGADSYLKPKMAKKLGIVDKISLIMPRTLMP